MVFFRDAGTEGSLERVNVLDREMKDVKMRCICYCSS